MKRVIRSVERFEGQPALKSGKRTAPPSASVRPKRGRPPRPSEDPEKDYRLFKDWKAAKATGIRSIEEFAKRRGEDSYDVRAALDRHRKRRRNGKK